MEGQQQNMKPVRRGPMRRISRPKYTVDFSIRVNGLTSAVRIRDLKAALIERGVRPNDISWRSTKGVALLHFAKVRVFFFKANYSYCIFSIYYFSVVYIVAFVFTKFWLAIGLN